MSHLCAVCFLIFRGLSPPHAANLPLSKPFDQSTFPAIPISVSGHMALCNCWEHPPWTVTVDFQAALPSWICAPLPLVPLPLAFT